MSRLVIGTAGHIDHGKTTLIEQLTGINLDSAPEEKERGITISLGFTSLSLSSGREISFIDVPGHEKLIRTMIAGATGFDGVLLCVSATDSIMPQTREHFEIVKLLGIQHGIIAITMCDLADEEDIELIEEEIAELVEGSFLEKAPVIHTSCKNEGFGQDELLQALENIPERISETSGIFRLPIDRVFSEKGFGTIVTGTSRDGTIADGATISVMPQNHSGRIRTIQVHGTDTKTASSHQRVALNLSGISHHDISRGDIIIPAHSIPLTSIIDVRYQHLTDAPTISDKDTVRLLFGSSEALAVIHLFEQETIEEAGEYFVQFRLVQPHIFMKDDLLIVRRESPLQTLGGGRVLDPFAPKLKTKNKEEQLAFIQQSLHNNIALLARHKAQGLDKQRAHLLGFSDQTHAQNMLGHHFFGTEQLASFRCTVQTKLQEWHAEHPLRFGISISELQHVTLPFLDKADFTVLLEKLKKEQQIVQKDGLLHHVSFQIEPTAQQKMEIDKLLQLLDSKGFEGFQLSDLSDFSKDIIQFVLESEVVIRIKTQFLSAHMISKLLECVRTFFIEHSEMSTGDFKELTQLSRKYCIPLLEWLDQKNYTFRKENHRCMGNIPPK